MSGLLGLKMSLKSVAKGALRVTQRNQSVCAVPVASFDEKSNKVTFHYLRWSKIFSLYLTLL
jgi:hypothetical protein